MVKADREPMAGRLWLVEGGKGWEREGGEEVKMLSIEEDMELILLELVVGASVG